MVGSVDPDQLLWFGQRIVERLKIGTGPKLVVGIVVDQMRWDYLYRYYGRYGESGF